MGTHAGCTRFGVGTHIYGVERDLTKRDYVVLQCGSGFLKDRCFLNDQGLRGRVEFVWEETRGYRGPEGSRVRE